MSPASIGVNLRVTGHCSQGGRKYMEDFFSVAYQQSGDEKDLEYAFFGIYDGHGGSEAAIFAKEHLMIEIVNQKLFWSDCDQDVLRAIREGYIATHYAMWREQEKWPKTSTGLPSTAGTTATVAFIRRGKIFIGHVGDSGIVLGYQEEGEKFWRSRPLTKDHKPECNVEKTRIISCGGKVVTKSGVPRVVWNRPRIGHKGPIRRSTPIDEIPFLAVARSLGDLWSYNSANNQFVVSPDPDVKVIKIDPKKFRCLIFGTDGLWNVMSATDAVSKVRDAEAINERLSIIKNDSCDWTNPSKSLVDRALNVWSSKKMRADNTSVVTILLDPPGAPKKEQSGSGSYGVEYMQVEADIREPIPNDYIANLPGDYPKHHQPPLHALNAYDLYDEEDSLNQTHQLSEFIMNDTESYATASGHSHQDHQHYTNNSVYQQANCDSNYMYYGNTDHLCLSQAATSRTCTVSPSNENLYMNSFAESYNSLLLSSFANENSRSSSNESNLSETSTASGNQSNQRTAYHLNQNYQYIDKVEDSGSIEQHEYQQQCMSAEEGYSLTKLETRCEQQLRNKSLTNSSIDTGGNNFQTFQVFGGDASTSQNFVDFSSSTSYDRNLKECIPIPTECCNEESNSNFLSSCDDEPRFYGPQATNIDTTESTSDSMHQDISREKYVNHEETTNDLIEINEEHDNEDVFENSIKQNDVIKNLEDDKNFTMDVDEKLNMDVVNKSHESIIIDEIEPKASVDESIQINEISSSVIESNSIDCVKQKRNEKIPSTNESLINIVIEPCRSTTRSKRQLFIAENSSNIKKSFPNVPNENQSTNSSRVHRSLSSTDSNPCDSKRQLRSKTIDYTKRTLRSRNSLSKDVKAKSVSKPASIYQLRRSIVPNQFIKTTAAIIERSGLNLRSRNVAIWASEATQKRNSNVKQNVSSKFCAIVNPKIETNLKSKQLSVGSSNNINNSKNSIIPTLITLNNTNSSPVSSSNYKSIKTTRGGTLLSTSAQTVPSVSSSTTNAEIKRSIRNSAWCSSSGKYSVQTRNRVQKRLSR